MKADFSRGYNPDRKRDRNYRRVLLQQGRVLLDSDAAALVDATDRLLRQTSRDLGTAAGGRNRGFMLTEGRTYALLEDLRRVTGLQGPSTFFRIDYNRRFRNRFPALRLESTAEAGGTVVIQLDSAFDPTAGVVIHAMSDTGIEPGFLQDTSGNPFGPVDRDIPSNMDDFQRFVLTPPNSPSSLSAVQISLPAGERRLWIALIESPEQLSQGTPVPFFIQPGRFHLDGLIVENSAEIPYQDQVSPAPTDEFTLAEGERAVAYLEAWERVVTAQEDPGIREPALNTADTAVRTEAVARVKTLITDNTLTADEIRAAFRNVVTPTGSLTLAVSETVASADPCSVSLEGGYTGRENLLYHFEVHSLDQGTLLLKWSRQAGSEEFAATLSGSSIAVDAAFGLRDGDLVELLSEAIDYGDQTDATITASEFEPPQRRVGELLRLSAEGTGFALQQGDSPASLDPTIYPDGQVRVRRWDGLIQRPLPAAAPVALENGFELTITGSGSDFRIGDWWQFEARDNYQDITSERHGPERLFAPLALLAPDLSDSLDQRVEISEWLDAPFVPISELTADRLTYDPTLLLQESEKDGAVVEVGAAEVQSLQAAFDLLAKRLLFRRTVVDRLIDERFLQDHNLLQGPVLGHWQMTVGDGAYDAASGATGCSFGDFSGPDAIQRAITAVRQLAGTGNPWSLRLFVKRGIYTISDAALTLAAGESLHLVGEGSAADLSAATQAPTTTIQAAITGPAIVVNENTHLTLESLAVINTNTSNTMGVLERNGGQLHITDCHLRDMQVALSASEGSHPNNAVVLRKCTLSTSFTQQPTGVRATFVNVSTASTSSVALSWPKVLMEDCDIRTAVDMSVADVAHTGTAVAEWEGLHIKSSIVDLAGASGVITPNTNPGLIGLREVTTDDVLTIRAAIFEECQVSSGSSGAGGPTGSLLHLRSGIDELLRVRRIELVAIRGGVWTVRGDTMANAGIFVGEWSYDAFTQGGDTRIDRLEVDGLRLGWSSESGSLQYGTTDGAGSAFALTANRVVVRNVRLFGAIRNPTIGEILVYGTRDGSVDGLLFSEVRAGGTAGIPTRRIHLVCGTNGIVATGIEVSSAFGIATEGVVRVDPVGLPPTTTQRAVLRGCRVRGNSAGAGFYKFGTVDLELSECSAIECNDGAFLTHGAAGTPGTSLVIRGGLYSHNLRHGIHVVVLSRDALVAIDSCVSTRNQESGIHLVPANFGADEHWDSRGPAITNNRVNYNALSGSNVADIRLGESNVDQIGGVCIGNYCRRDTTEGVIEVRAQFEFNMRGLSLSGETPTSTRGPGTGSMAFNHAVWRTDISS